MFDWSKYAVGGAKRPDSFTGLNTNFSTALSQMLQAAEAELGQNALSITSAYRSPEKQAELYQAALKKYGSPAAARKWVAPPGRSMHNKGLAVDFGAAGGGLLRDPNSREAQWLKANASRFGLDVPMSWEPWQVELAGARGGKKIAAETMSLLGKGPQTATTGTQGAAPMMQQEQKPRGLLGSLGIQKMEEGAEGETGQRFYNRDSFKDTAAILAQGFGRMGIMGMEEIADSVANQRTENKARNKTAEYLRANGRGDLADMVDQGLIGGREAAGVLLQKPEEKGQVVSAEQLRKLYPNSEIAEGLYNLKKDGTVSKVGGAPQVVVNSGDKGESKFAELDAKTLVDVGATGMQAQRSIGQINRLASLLEGLPTGAVGAIKVAAGNFGIQTEGLDDLQAAQALINSLVPQQRPAGSGPMSDADLELFKQSLPRIINSPNGNQIILETMRGIAAYDAAGAEIVQKYRNGGITQAQAFSELQSRPDPFAGVNLGVATPQGGGMTREDALKVLGDG